MPRKIKTVSPARKNTNPYAGGGKAVRRLAKIDLCRIDTARFRSMTPEQLKLARGRVGPIFTMPKKESGRGAFRWVLGLFLSNLIEAKTTPVTPRDVEFSEAGYYEGGESEYRAKHRAKIRETIEQRVADNKDRVDKTKRDAVELERLIWDMQAKAGCKIAGEELVARDAEREGKPEVAAKLRAQRRRPPTPHKRPAKIR